MQNLYVILPWILIFGVFWFFLIRPQRNQQKERQQMLKSLEVGDKIVTVGGIKGKIIKIKDDQIRLRISSNVDIDVVRSAIGQLDDSEEENKENGEDNK